MGDSVTELSYEHHFEFPIHKVVVKGRSRKDIGSLDGLAASIEHKGLLQPIGLTPKGTLIWGERRLEAHKQLGREVIRAYVVSGADETDLLEMEHDENEIRLHFHWTERAQITKAIFESQKTRMRKKGKVWTQDEHAATYGMSQKTVSRQLALAEALEAQPELVKFQNQEDAEKQLSRDEEVKVLKLLREKVAATHNAPKWAKDHYIIGDALDGMAQMSDETFDFAEVDPPYGIELDRRKGRNLDRLHTSDYNEIGVEAFPPFMRNVANETFRLLKPNTFAVFWYGMQWHCEMFAWLRLAGFSVNPVPCIWYKGVVGQTAQPDVAFGSVYEPFWLARKGTPKMLLQGKPNVFHFASVPPTKKIHTTEKPIELLSDLLGTILFPGSNILVPFLGSGVTLRAAYRLGHTGLGFDLSAENKARFLDLVQRDRKPEAHGDTNGDQE
jgi:ParB/RepB/Spo0J family partition protein